MSKCWFFWHNWEARHDLRINPDGIHDGELACILTYQRCSKCEKTKAYQYRIFYNNFNIGDPQRHNNQIKEIKKFYWRNYK